MKIERVQVASSQVRSVGHHPESNTLSVEFHGWGSKAASVYHYHDVPADVHKAFMESESKGRFLNQNIKGKYKYTRQEEEQQNHGTPSPT